MNAQRIPTEIIQIFTPSQARGYGIIPFEKDGCRIKCHGSGSVTYGAVTEEIFAIFGYEIEIVPCPESELQKLLDQYYRKVDGERKTVSENFNPNTKEGFLKGLIRDAYSNKVSDIHIEIYEERCRIRYRIDGKLIERYVIEKANYPSLVNQIKIIANLDISEKRLSQDGRIMFDTDDACFDIRVSSLPTIYGEKIVMRLLVRNQELLSIENLGLDERQFSDYCDAIEKPHGMILICGPTGSGKSTTLYATLRRLNKETGNILTIEDPVEYTLEGVNQVQLREDIGFTFASALRTFLRQDPDIIMIGEIRDSETANMAVRSSLTGHLIFSTIHTNSAWGSIARMTDMGVHPYLISDTLILAAAQRLVRILCPHCKRPLDQNEIPRDFVSSLSNAEKYAAVGCTNCFNTGYRGRKAIYEVIPIDRELSDAVRRNSADVDAMLSERGISLLSDSALKLFDCGETGLEEIIPYLKN